MKNNLVAGNRWLNRFMFTLLFASFVILQGCDSITSSEEAVSITTPDQKVATSKLRHEALINKALRADTTAGKSNNQKLGIVFKVSPQKVLERYRILDRYKIMDRYKILDRYEYSNVFDGFAIEAEDLTGQNDFRELMLALENDPDVVWYEPDFSVDIPSQNSSQASSGQLIPWSVSVIGAEESSVVAGDGNDVPVYVDVFVLDTGVAKADYNDPNDDLRLIRNMDFRENSNDAKDYDGHGTHIAGIIGAIDDNDKVVGVAPGVWLHNYKVLNDDGKTDVSVVIEAIDEIMQWRIYNQHRPFLVNLSLGENVGTSEYTALDEAIQTASGHGVIFVAAAGNQGTQVSNITPAHSSEVITVGSFGMNGTHSPFSNYGPGVDILAPGENILSLGPNGNIVSMTGTSMSTAHVTGAVALYLKDNPNATLQDVKNALLSNAKSFVSGMPANTTNKSVWVGNF